MVVIVVVVKGHGLVTCCFSKPSYSKIWRKNSRSQDLGTFTQIEPVAGVKRTNDMYTRLQFSQVRSKGPSATCRVSPVTDRSRRG